MCKGHVLYISTLELLSSIRNMIGRENAESDQPHVDGESIREGVKVEEGDTPVGFEFNHVESPATSDNNSLSLEFLGEEISSQSKS